jgi:hypothetical protein
MLRDVPIGAKLFTYPASAFDAAADEPVAEVVIGWSASQPKRVKLLREVPLGTKLYVARRHCVSGAAAAALSAPATETGAISDAQVNAATDVLRLEFAIYLTPSSVRQVLRAALAAPASATPAVKTDALPNVECMVKNAKSSSRLRGPGSACSRRRCLAT